MLNQIIDLIKKLCRQFFWKADNWLKYGDKERRSGRLAKAIESYNQVIKLDANNYLAWQKKAYTLLDMQAYSEAIVCLDKALKLDSSSSDVWCQRAKILLHINRKEEAIKSYNKALKIDPKNIEALISKGDLLSANNSKLALECYDAVLNLQPKNTQIIRKRNLLLPQQQKGTLLSQANNLHETDNFQEAIKIYEQLISEQPNLAEAWYKHGRALYELEKYNNAVNSFYRATQINDNNFDYW